jgi:hypothetical protein
MRRTNVPSLSIGLLDRIEGSVVLVSHPTAVTEVIVEAANAATTTFVNNGSEQPV